MKRKSNTIKEKTKKLLDGEKKYKDIMREVEPFLPKKSHILKREHGEWNIDIMSPPISIQVKNNE